MKFKVILADPPWNYFDKRANHSRICGGAEAHYKTMKIDDIKALPVADIAEENAILFLWATFPNLQEALDVIKAWHFTYKTLGFNWMKLNKKNGKPFFGIGSYTNSGSEICLIGIHGKGLQRVHKDVSSSILSPLEAHSKKPDEVRKRIERLYGDVPRIELFARQRVEGWTSIGLEIDGKDIREALEEIKNAKKI